VTGFLNWKLLRSNLAPFYESYVELAAFLALLLLVAISMTVRRRRQLWRHVVQALSIAVFFFLISTCLGVFGLVRNAWFGLELPGQDDLRAFYWLAPTVAILGLSFTFGPVFCGWICPTGALQELVGSLRGLLPGGAGRQTSGKVAGRSSDLPYPSPAGGAGRQTRGRAAGRSSDLPYPSPAGSAGRQTRGRAAGRSSDLPYPSPAGGAGRQTRGKVAGRSGDLPYRLVVVALIAAGMVVYLVVVRAVFSTRASQLEDSAVLWAAALAAIVAVAVLHPGSDQALKRLRWVSLGLLLAMCLAGITVTSPVHFVFSNVHDWASLLSSLLIMGMSLAVMRAWCRYLCPFGVLCSLAGTVALRRITVTEACDGCNRCAGVCGTAAIERGQVARDACTMCLACVDACPQGALLERMEGEG